MQHWRFLKTTNKRRHTVGLLRLIKILWKASSYKQKANETRQTVCCPSSFLFLIFFFSFSPSSPTYKRIKWMKEWFFLFPLTESGSYTSQKLQQRGDFYLPSFLSINPFSFFFSSSFLLRTNARQRPVPIFLTNWWKVMKTKKILTHQSFQVNRKEKKKRYIHHIALFTDVMDDADKDTRRRVLTGSTSYRCIYIYIYLLFIYDLFLNKMH